MAESATGPTPIPSPDRRVLVLSSAVFSEALFQQRPGPFRVPQPDISPWAHAELIPVMLLLLVIAWKFLRKKRLHLAVAQSDKLHSAHTFPNLRWPVLCYTES
jgi:hypothetical protein